jgi:hypothetical protein
LTNGRLLTIEVTGEALTLAATTILQDGRPVSEAPSLNLDGEPTIGSGGVATVFKAIDRSTFEITMTLTGSASGEVTGVNRFAFSPDGRSLVETKTQSRRTTAATRQAAPQESGQGPVTSVLVFERQE